MMDIDALIDGLDNQVLILESKLGIQAQVEMVKNEEAPQS